MKNALVAGLTALSLAASGVAIAQPAGGGLVGPLEPVGADH